MQIQIHSDKNIDSTERLHAYIANDLETALARFESKITSIEVGLNDENADKFDEKDKRCVIEVRLAGKPPVAVTNFADTHEKAFHGATDKIKRVLSTSFDKMHDH